MSNARHDAHRPNENEERKNQEERERPPKKTHKKHGPPTGSLILISFCGVTVTANILANLPTKSLPSRKLNTCRSRSAATRRAAAACRGTAPRCTTGSLPSGRWKGPPGVPVPWRASFAADGRSGFFRNLPGGDGPACLQRKATPLCGQLVPRFTVAPLKSTSGS